MVVLTATRAASRGMGCCAADRMGWTRLPRAFQPRWTSSTEGIWKLVHWVPSRQEYEGAQTRNSPVRETFVCDPQAGARAVEQQR